MVRQIAVDLVRRAEDERRAGAWRRVASSRLSVPLALTPKVGLRIGRRPVVRRLGSGVDHELERAAQSAKTPLDGVGVADVELERAERSPSVRRSRSVVCAVDADGPKNRARMSFSRPMTSKPAATKCWTDSDPISPPEPVTIAVGIARSEALRSGGQAGVTRDAFETTVAYPAIAMNYQRLYEYRFRDVDQSARTAVWHEIAPFIHEPLGHPRKVLDPAAGRGEFINAVPAQERWAIDQVAYAEGTYRSNVRSIVSDIFEAELPAAHFDGMFVSNFLEHLLVPGGGGDVPRPDARRRRARRPDRGHGPELPLLLAGVLRHGRPHADLHPPGDRRAPVRGGL